MKVLQINVCVNTSSTGKITEEIGKLLIENGHESYIAYGRTNRGSVSQLIKIGNRFDVLMHVMRTRVFDRHGFASTLATKKLIKQIRKIQPDVICLHNLHGYYINIDILFKFLKTAEIPVVWTLFDVWAFTGHCSYFEIPGGKDCLKWKNECNHCIKKSRYPSSFFKDNSQQNFLDKKALYSELPNLQIVVHSKWLQILVQQSILQNSKTHLINSGIDADVFKPVAVSKVIEKYNLFGYKIILGVANIWDRRKGLNDFVTLSKSLDYYEKIVLVGITKHQKKILPKNIVAIEQTESIEELCEIYSMADVFVNPTYSDNFPTTNLLKSTMTL